MAQKTIAIVSDAQGSPLAVDVEVSGHHIFGDEPVVQGGKNLGPTPFDLLTAALGECTAMTIRWYAMRQRWPIEHVRVEVHHTKKMEAGADTIFDEFSKTIEIVAPDLDDEQRRKLIEIAAKCPIHKTLTGEIRITTREVSEKVR